MAKLVGRVAADHGAIASHVPPAFTPRHDPLTGRTGIDSGNIHLFVFLRALRIPACSAGQDRTETDTPPLFSSVRERRAI